MSRLGVPPFFLALTLLNPAAASARTPPPQEAASATDTHQTHGVVLVELLVEDTRGRPIIDLTPAEMVVLQDDVRQTILSLDYLAQYGHYELRYVPQSGQVGAVSIRVLRSGTHLRGPEGPQVKPKWVPPIQPFELPLREALEAPQPPSDFDYDIAVLRFEVREGTLHHSFIAEIPLKVVAIERTGDQAQAHLSFLLRVKTDAGRTLHEASLDQPIAFVAGNALTVSVMRFVWSSHLHLRPGRYVVEMAVMDQRAAHRSVHRFPLRVDPWTEGLRLSSVTFLLGRDGLMAGEGDDNPFRLEDSALVPMLHPTVTGSEGRLSLFAVLYPDRTAQEPVSAAIELYRDGELRAKAAIPLPAADTEGRIRYLGGLRFQSLQAGSYEVRLVAQQGALRLEEKAALSVSAPLRVN
jgi:hypothetical protein